MASNMCTETQLGYTEVIIEQVMYKWTINHFELLLEKCQEFVESPVFYTKDQKLKWVLALYPHGKDTSDTDKVALYLAPKSCDVLNVKMQIELSILKSNTVIATKQFTHTYDSLNGRGLSEFIRRPEILPLNDSDRITVCCKIDIPSTPYVTSSSVDKKMPLGVMANQLVDDFCEAFREPKHCDISIIVGNERLSAHKFVLAARSSVFSAMFDQKEMTENLKSQVKIEDIDAPVVKAMLEFIYTDKVTDLAPLVKGLLTAADKYDLERLRTLCEKSLYETVNNENAAELLILADLHNAKKLKNGVMQFIANHSSNVLLSEGYKKTKETLLAYPVLLLELMDAVVLQKDTKIEDQKS